jgi:hypothetical protein
MARQYSTRVRNALLQVYEDTIGTAPALELRSGSQPATCATADSGTLLVPITLPSDWQAVPAAGVAAIAGTWQGLATVAGTIGHYRLKGTGSTVDEQGKVTSAFGRATSASTSANSNVLTFTSTAGILVGQAVSGTGIVEGSLVTEVGATTVKLSLISTAGVSNGVTVYFGDTTGDMWLPTLTVAVNQVVVVSSRGFTAPGA